jgi:hypothetical protein
MTQHILSLSEGKSANEGIFLINDTSLYAPSIPVLCPTLEILPPGYRTPAVLTITPGAHLVLNACSIGVLPATGCADSAPILPDGIYNLRYSVSPNSGVYVEYDLLRIVHAWNRLNEVLCQLGLRCQLPDKELEYSVYQCAIIREYLIGAKAMVEDKHQMQDGINTYRFAYSLIEKMSIGRNCKAW